MKPEVFFVRIHRRSRRRGFLDEAAGADMRGAPVIITEPQPAAAGERHHVRIASGRMASRGRRQPFTRLRSLIRHYPAGAPDQILGAI